MATEPMHIGVITALREEAAAVTRVLESLAVERQERIHLLQAGLGGAKAAEGARKLLAREPRLGLLVMTGFCGGLAEGLPVGGVVLAQAVTARRSAEVPGHTSEALTVPAEVLARAEAALRQAGCAFTSGQIATVAEPVVSSQAKRALGEVTGAVAVDMESAALARVARERGVAWLVLRTVSDSVGDDLPHQVSSFLDAQGAVRHGQVLRYAAQGPRSLTQLWRLKSRSDQAAAALTEAWRALLAALVP